MFSDRHLEIEKRVAADTALNDLLSNYSNALQRVQELNGQIERSDRADIVRSILADVRATGGNQRQEFFIRFMGNRIDIYPAVEALKKLTSIYVDLIKKLP